MQLAYHPAPGLGDLLPGFYDVPQNPLSGRGISYIPRIGDILPAAYVVPQNPIRDFTTGQVKLIGQKGGGVGCGCGCGASGGCGKINGTPVAGVAGIGDLATDWANIQASISAGNYMGVLTDTIYGVPLWAIAAAVGLFMFAGGEQHSYVGRGRRAARAAARAF